MREPPEVKKERLGDPASWSCLSDEQRDIIHAWYMNIIGHHQAEVTFIRESTLAASYFSLIPLAIFWVFRSGIGEFTFRTLVGTLCVWIFDAFVFTMFFKGYGEINPEKPPRPLELVWQILVACFFSIVISYMLFE